MSRGKGHVFGWSSMPPRVGRSKMKGCYSPHSRRERNDPGYETPGRRLNVITVPMSVETIEAKLEHSQAYEMEPMSDEEAMRRCPLIQCLGEQERQAWLLFVRGVIAKEIGEIMGLRKDEVSRLLAAVRSEIRFAHRFWLLLPPEVRATMRVLWDKKAEELEER